MGAVLVACAEPAPQLVVFNAGSLAAPMRAALDSFAARTGAAYAQESSGSLEAARKLTELHRIPDIIALADHEVFPALLHPEHIGWYMEFARNRMVLVYSERSRFAGELSAGNWADVLQRPGVEVGRADPALDPAGYRAILLFRLAERHMGRPGLAAQLLASSPDRNVRPKAVDLIALLEAGELDYFWSYESVARAAGLRFLALAPEIDLSDPALADQYASVSIRVPGASRGDSVTIAGTPIVYALSIPRQAEHQALAADFLEYLLSADGVRVLRSLWLDVLDQPLMRGAEVSAPATATGGSGG